ncbi:MAG: ectonucleotide pyrophosphatase/phosphodiesterase [Angelakisella sp.]
MKKLIVLSADALVWEDMEYFKTLPNYKKYLAGGCEVQKVRSVYPTITYPCHTTMSTGVYPNRHGVYSNYQLIPGQAPLPWRWDYSNNKCKQDIFTEAKKAGYSTAAVFWPTTGNHPDIDYLIDEYWTQSPEDTPREAWTRMGSDSRMLDVIERNIGNNDIRKHPQTDRFIISCCCDIIRQYQPDILFLHPANIDAYRHQYGLFNDHVRFGIEETDRWIGELMEAAEEAGVLADTNLVITSDHGQLDIKRVVNPNVVLADKGLIAVNSDGTLGDWKAWCMSGGLSAVVFLKDPNDVQLYNETYELLQWMAKEGVYGISRVFTEQEANESHHLGKAGFSFVLESDDFTSFGDGFVRPMVTNFDSSDYRYGRATHGHLPHKGPQPTFMAKGPDFNENITIETANLVDQAPTYAKLLGIELAGVDGIPLDAFIKSGRR